MCWFYSCLPNVVLCRTIGPGLCHFMAVYLVLVCAGFIFSLLVSVSVGTVAAGFLPFLSQFV